VEPPPAKDDCGCKAQLDRIEAEVNAHRKALSMKKGAVKRCAKVEVSKHPVSIFRHDITRAKSYPLLHVGYTF
jgi:hypothetical protein